MGLRDQLQQVYDDHGKLTPTLVVDVARPEDHPLHERFEWDDAIAGEAWRRRQAHELIRSVKIVVKPANDITPETSVRAWQAVRGEDEDPGGYVYEPAEKVAEDPRLREIVLRDMERDWQDLKRRYSAFAEFVEMVRRDVEDAA